MDNKTLAAIAGALALIVLGWGVAAIDGLSARLDDLNERDREMRERLSSLEAFAAAADDQLGRVVAYVIRQHQRNEAVLDKGRAAPP